MPRDGLYTRVVGHPRIAPLKPTWVRSRYVARPWRFLLRETLRRDTTNVYPLRDRVDVSVAVRHSTIDLETFDQIFRQGALREPPAVANVLDGLGRPPVVLDLGANIGTSAAWWAWRWPGARVVCVEPDAFNVQVLTAAAETAGGRWRVVDAAAATADGTLRFASGGFSMSRSSDDGEVLVQAVDVFALAAEERPDLIKIDIEGAEWPILADERFARLEAAAIAIEFHPHGCDAPDARAEAFDRLQAAGYEVIEVPHVAGAPADEGSLWAWRAP